MRDQGGPGTNSVAQGLGPRLHDDEDETKSLQAGRCPTRKEEGLKDDNQIK